MNEAISPQQVLLYPDYPTQDKDEINLFDLIRALLKRKSLIITITSIFAIASIIAVLLMQRSWQAEIRFMPPKLKDIHGLNVQGLANQDGEEQGYKEVQYTQASVYNKFFTNYQSISQRRHFFNQNELIKYYQSEPDEDKIVRAKSMERAFKEFNNSLKLRLPKKKTQVTFVSSTLEFTDQTASSEYLNKYAQLVKKRTLNDVLQEVTSKLQQKQTNLKEQILIKKRIAKQIRENRTYILSEAIKIAKLLKLDGATEVLPNSEVEVSPLYLRGYEALEAEKKILEERKDDTPFIDGLIELEYQYSQLSEQIKRLANGKDKFSVVTIDQKAITPESPVKPKRKLIVIMSTLLGFIVSLLIIFFLNLTQKYNENYQG
ncbi:MAG: Wzz/FepE/Etk N-terminal domain-containing protein [Gammaproteobacteria bacterium]|nr:Wzz/FepE/Etk N-terminal domain-containing protein [Gammaproteobacteria bacterium]